MNLLKKINNLRAFIIVIAITALLTGSSVYILKPNSYIAGFPFISADLLNITPDEWVCESAVFSRLGADKDSVYEKRDGIKGEVTKGTDKVNLKVEGDVLKFNTRAAFEAGFIDAAPFEIFRNDDKFLIALDTNQERTYIETIIVEKSTGLATWTRNRTYVFDPEGHPEVQSFYFICR